MKLYLALILAAIPATAMNRAQGWCEQGNKTISVQGQTSSTNTPVQRSYPSCTVTVYITGSSPLTLATIYSTNTGTALANPFTADSTGYWAFFAVDGNYDVKFSGANIPTPFTQGAHGVIDTMFDSTVNGYVPRTKNAKMADIMSVKDLGAVGDGVADDTAAIAQAITNTSYTPTVQKCIYFPDGVYNTTAAVAATKQICFVGNAYRIKYTGSSTISAVLTITGFFRGLFISGMILDGLGKATDGLSLKAGVVSGQIIDLRVTNVTDAGIHYNWAQQIDCQRCMVSSNYETFTTVPARGLVIEGASSANTFNQINIEHVSGTGIDLKYAVNSLFYGGTSEGNGGYGVSCAGSVSPFVQCIQNAFVQLDTEVNTSGDYFFGDLAYFNTVVNANSFSKPGVHFGGALTRPFCAHQNTIIGGSIGALSIADACTFGNRLINVGAFVVSLTDVPWIDNGSNYNDPIYDQFNSRTFAPADNNHLTMVSTSAAGSNRTIRTYTPLVGTSAGLTVGDPAASFIGFDTQNGFAAAWLKYNVVGGMQFMSETAPETGAIADGIILNHKWGIGRFFPTPLYTLHLFDSVLNTFAVQAGAGQGGADLAKFINLGGTRLSGVTWDGKWDGPILGGAIGQALCKKADSTIGYCSTVVAAGGSCTCN